MTTSHMELNVVASMIDLDKLYVTSNSLPYPHYNTTKGTKTGYIEGECG